MSKYITQEKLLKKYKYDPSTGFFTRRTQEKSSKFKVGTIAGCTTSGYVTIFINKIEHKAHRLAFLYMTGELPEEVDHINHITTDNRWSNLRSVTRQENMKNKRKYKNNNTGVTGVQWDKTSNRWRARIRFHKKEVHLGMFVEFSEAVNARKNAEVLYGFHENHGKDIL